MDINNIMDDNQALIQHLTLNLTLIPGLTDVEKAPSNKQDSGQFASGHEGEY